MKNKKNKLARALCAGTSIIALSLTANVASAQSASSDSSVDEVVVSGIRQSLEKSVDVKRNAKGIVDSITAEDIGKFPDSNLVAMMQRLSVQARQQVEALPTHKQFLKENFG